jgi:MFS family permease
MADLPNPIPAAIAAPALAPAENSPWAPLREPLFRALWIASIASYTGSWMQNIGTGWCMTTLTESPMSVALVQAAMSLPVFLVTLPAGALADMVDRRRLLLVTQWWMLIAAVLLAVITMTQHVTPALLLLFTFMMGLGAVMNDPAWQAITPEVVSQRNFASAVALNSAGFNIARAVGPVLGGLVIAFSGSGAAFLLNAASFLGVIIFLYRWKCEPHPAPVPLARLRATVVEGIGYVRTATPVRSVMIRAGLFSLFASVLWALLPLVGSPFGSIGYGTMLASFGLGSLAGAGVLPACRRLVSVNVLFAAATALFASAVAAIALLSSHLALIAAMFIAGLGWIVVLTSLNVCAQTNAPDWVRARTLSMYLLVWQGGMAAGSALWGAVAERWGLPAAFLAAAAGLTLGLFTIKHYHLEVKPLELRTANL